MYPTASHRQTSHTEVVFFKNKKQSICLHTCILKWRINRWWMKKKICSHFFFSYCNDTHWKHSVAPRRSCINRVSMTRQPRCTQWRLGQSFLPPLFCLNMSSYWLMLHTQKSAHILVARTFQGKLLLLIYQSKYHLHSEEISGKCNMSTQ